MIPAESQGHEMNANRENFWCAILREEFVPIPCTYEEWGDSIDPRLHPTYSPVLKQQTVHGWPVELWFLGRSLTDAGPKHFTIELSHESHMQLGSEWETYAEVFDAFDRTVARCRIEADD
jgi:hypothetical protein